MKYNFKKKVQGSEVVDYGVPYDYASIMHYPCTCIDDKFIFDAGKLF